MREEIRERGLARWGVGGARERSANSGMEGCEAVVVVAATAGDGVRGDFSQGDGGVGCCCGRCSLSRSCSMAWWESWLKRLSAMDTADVTAAEKNK